MDSTLNMATNNNLHQKIINANSLFGIFNFFARLLFLTLIDRKIERHVCEFPLRFFFGEQLV